MGIITDEIVARFLWKSKDGDVKKTKTEIKDLRKELGLTKSGLNAIRRGMAEAFAVRLAARGIAGTTRALVQTNTQFEILKARLKTTEKGVEAANAKFAEIIQFAKDTPFQVSNLTDAFVTLRNVGIDPTTDDFRSLADTAAAQGRDIMDLAIATRGAVTGEFEALKSFGIVARVEGDKLRVQFGNNTRVIERDATSVFNLLTEIGRTQFAGAAQDQMATMAGAISNLEDNLDAFMLKIGESGFNEAVARIFTDVGNAIGESDALAEAVGTGLTEALEVVAELITDIIEAAGDLRPDEVRSGLRSVRKAVFDLVEILKSLSSILSTVAVALNGPKGIIAAYVAWKSASAAVTLKMRAMDAQTDRSRRALSGFSKALSGLGIAIAGLQVAVSALSSGFEEMSEKAGEAAEEARKAAEEHTKGVTERGNIIEADNLLKSRERALEQAKIERDKLLEERRRTAEFNTDNPVINPFADLGVSPEEAALAGLRTAKNLLGGTSDIDLKLKEAEDRVSNLELEVRGLENAKRKIVQETYAGLADRERMLAEARDEQARKIRRRKDDPAFRIFTDLPVEMRNKLEQSQRKEIIDTARKLLKKGVKESDVKRKVREAARRAAAGRLDLFATKKADAGLAEDLLKSTIEDVVREEAQEFMGELVLKNIGARELERRTREFERRRKRELEEQASRGDFSAIGGPFSQQEILMRQLKKQGINVDVESAPVIAVTINEFEIHQDLKFDVESHVMQGEANMRDLAEQIRKIVREDLAGAILAVSPSRNR